MTYPDAKAAVQAVKEQVDEVATWAHQSGDLILMEAVQRLADEAHGLSEQLEKRRELHQLNPQKSEDK